MRLLHVSCAVLLACLPVVAAAPDDVIEFPAAPVVPLPPAPPPHAANKLAAGQVFDIRCKTNCVVRAYPAGLVSITKEVVPAGETLRVRDEFVDGAKSRTYKGPVTIYSVRAIGTGKVDVVVTPVGFKVESEIKTVGLDVDAGQGPQPPPPDPKPKPKPEPEPDPVVKVESVWVVVVEDANAPRTLDTAKALNDGFWVTLKPKHDFRHYRSDSVTAVENGYVEQAKKVGYPAVLVLDAKDGDVLKAFKLGGVDGIKDAVRGVVK